MPEMTRFVGVDKFLPRWNSVTVYSLQIEREKKKPKRRAHHGVHRGHREEGRAEGLWRYVVRAHPYKPRVGHPQVQLFRGVTKIEEHRKEWLFYGAIDWDLVCAVSGDKKRVRRDKGTQSRVYTPNVDERHQKRTKCRQIKAQASLPS